MQNIRKRYNIKKLISLIVLLVAMLLPGGIVKAQNVSVNAKLDSTLLYIGGQMNLTLELSQPKDVNIVFPQFTDTITKVIEVVSATPVDTTFLDNNRLTLTQQYTITCFDSGLQYIPPIKFELAQEEVHKIYETQSMALTVINPFESVDPKKGISDIKKPIDSPFSLAELLPYLKWIFLALVVIGLIVYLIIRYNRKADGPVVKKSKPKEPPHITALRDLNRIKAEKLWQKDKVKKYHSEITDTIRLYIENRFNIQSLEQTTEETLDALKGIELTDDNAYEKLKQILELADLVKFAKLKPLPDENELSMTNALFFVNQTKEEVMKSLKEEKEEREETEGSQQLAVDSKQSAVSSGQSSGDSQQSPDSSQPEKPEGSVD